MQGYEFPYSVANCISRLTGWRAALATVVGAALTAASAQVCFYLPGNPVPVTFQVFAVALCGMLLGPRLAAVSQMEYLVAGVLGLPVFAGFRCGMSALAGPTGGYLVAFVPAAYVIGFLAWRFTGSLAGLAAAGFTGVAVIYTLGRAWLAIWLGDVNSLNSWILGVLPFVGLDLVKVTIAALACRRLLWKH
ncbi:MAG: biotin transporter BioY [Armatimonadota bacterium]|nr:biotin transporter BioY [Armatimonadota bacterium]